MPKIRITDGRLAGHFRQTADSVGTRSVGDGRIEVIPTAVAKLRDMETRSVPDIYPGMYQVTYPRSGSVGTGELAGVAGLPARTVRVIEWNAWTDAGASISNLEVISVTSSLVVVQKLSVQTAMRVHELSGGSAAGCAYRWVGSLAIPEGGGLAVRGAAGVALVSPIAGKPGFLTSAVATPGSPLTGVTTANAGSLRIRWDGYEANTYMTELIDVHSGYTAASGTVSASSEANAAYVAWYAVDPRPGPRWEPLTYLNAWLKYDFGVTRKVFAYEVGCSGATFGLKSWVIEVSNNNTDWTVVDTRSGQTWPELNTTFTFVLSEPKGISARYWRIRLTDAATQQIETFQLLGR